MFYFSVNIMLSKYVSLVNWHLVHTSLLSEKIEHKIVVCKLINHKLQNYELLYYPFRLILEYNLYTVFQLIDVNFFIFKIIERYIFKILRISNLFIYFWLYSTNHKVKFWIPNVWYINCICKNGHIYYIHSFQIGEYICSFRWKVGSHKSKVLPHTNNLHLHGMGSEISESKSY